MVAPRRLLPGRVANVAGREINAPYYWVTRSNICIVPDPNPVSLLPSHFGMAGKTYSTIAMLLGSAYLMASVLFAMNETRTSARRVLWTSLIYLPLLLLTLTWDHLRLLERL